MFESVVSLIRCCLLASLTLLAACDRLRYLSDAKPVAEVAAGEANGSVWVADKPGQPGRLFLCGTIHILREQDYPLSPGYDAGYENSTKLVFELPPDAGADNALSNRMRELGSYPTGDSLQAHVSSETWKGVQSWAEKRGVPLATLRGFRPWFLALLITSTEYAALGAKADQGVDQHYEARAKKDGKPGQGLETAEFQIQLFTQLNEAQQNNLLEQTLAEISTLPAEYEKMINAWKQGDLKVLHDMLFREAERYPELMDLFLNNRNRAWIDPLVEMLKKGENAMILVGTGHLAGETGLIKLLETRGYRVRHYPDIRD